MQSPTSNLPSCAFVGFMVPFVVSGRVKTSHGWSSQNQPVVSRNPLQVRSLNGYKSWSVGKPSGFPDDAPFTAKANHKASAAERHNHVFNGDTNRGLAFRTRSMEEPVIDIQGVNLPGRGLRVPGQPAFFAHRFRSNALDQWDCFSTA